MDYSKPSSEELEQILLLWKSEPIFFDPIKKYQLCVEGKLQKNSNTEGEEGEENDPRRDRH